MRHHAPNPADFFGDVGEPFHGVFPCGGVLGFDLGDLPARLVHGAAHGGGDVVGADLVEMRLVA